MDTGHDLAVCPPSAERPGQRLQGTCSLPPVTTASPHKDTGTRGRLLHSLCLGFLGSRAKELDLGGLWTTKSLCPARSQHQRRREMLSPRGRHSGRPPSPRRGRLPTGRADESTTRLPQPPGGRRRRRCGASRGLDARHPRAPGARRPAVPPRLSPSSF